MRLLRPDYVTRGHFGLVKLCLTEAQAFSGKSSKISRGKAACPGKSQDFYSCSFHTEKQKMKPAEGRFRRSKVCIFGVLQCE